MDRMQNFYLLPYIERDGIRTVPDSDIKRLFRKTKDQGLDKVVFYEGSIRTECEFLEMARAGHQQVLFYLLLDGMDTIGYVWLNRFENHTARQHFCVFKEYWGRTLEIGKWVLHELMYLKDKEGRFCFDLLTGFVPVWNKRAIQFSLKCGGQTYGKIPNAIWNHETGQSEDAMFIYYMRGTDDLSE